MAFDWKDFAAVFLEKTAENIERRGEEARTYREEEKQAAKRNAELINERAARAKQAASYARKAKAYLGSHPQADLMVKAAISDGPAGIQDLYQKLEAAANQPGQNGMLGQADIDTLINMPELPPIEQKYIDMGLESFAMQTYGASKDALIRPAEEQGEVGLVGQLFGFGAKQRVDEQLSKQQYGMGMSISDINDLAEQAEYQNIIKDTSLTYGTLDRFDLDDYTKFDAIITKAIKDAMDANETALNAANDRLLDDAERDKFKTGIQRSAAEPLIAESVRENPRMLQSPSVAQRIVAVMGQDYLDKLYVEYNIFTKAQLEEMRGEGGGVEPAATGAEPAATGAEPVAAEPAATPDGTATVSPRHVDNVDPLDLNPAPSQEVEEWDRKYGGKYDPLTGAPIIVGKRPALDEYREERRIAGGRVRRISLHTEWMNKYGDTHDPETGLPLPVEE
jgi:hypothetical protein